MKNRFLAAALLTIGCLVFSLGSSAGLLVACAPAVLGQGQIELTPADIDRIEFKGLAPTKTAQRALVSFHVSDSTRNRAKSAGQSLPLNISVGINNKPFDAKLSDDQSYYSTEIEAPRRLPLNQSTAFRRQDSGIVKSEGPAANPNFYIEFGQCAKGCKSIIFHHPCLVCITKIGW